MFFAGKDISYLSHKKYEKILKIKKSNKKLKDAPPMINRYQEEEKKDFLNKKSINNNNNISINNNLNNNNNNISINNNSNNNYTIFSNLNFSEAPPFDRQSRNSNLNSKIENKDTNIILLKFDILTEDFPKINKLIKCINCEAIINKFSSIKIVGIEKYEWKCEFCGYKNIYKGNDIFKYNKYLKFEYTLNEKYEKPNNKNFYDFNNNSSSFSNKIIYCFDTSSSMNSKKYTVSNELFKKIVKNKKNNKNRRNSLSNEVSRLECLLSSIESNIKTTLNNSPTTQIGLITFDSFVNIYGDCSQKPFKITKDEDLNSLINLENLVYSNRNLLSFEIKDSYQNILAQLNDIKTCGSTALGPGIYSAIHLIGNQTGGTIFLCTDGVANNGIGSLVKNMSDEEKKKIYKEIGKTACEFGITINLITFDDEESNIKILLEMVRLTGGEIIRVNVNNILKDFNLLLNNNTIGFNVEISLNVNKIVTFKNEQEENLKNNQSTLIKKIGNVKKDSEYYFEYKFKKANVIANMNDINIEKMKEIIFQAKIEYTNLNGKRIVKIINEKTKISCNINKIIEDSNMSIIMSNVLQQSFNKSLDDNFDNESLKNWNNFFKQNASLNESKKFNNIIKNINNFSNDRYSSISYQNYRTPSNIIKSEIVEDEENFL